jgi:hypothetical protein
MSDDEHGDSHQSDEKERDPAQSEKASKPVSLGTMSSERRTSSYRSVNVAGNPCPELISFAKEAIVTFLNDYEWYSKIHADGIADGSIEPKIKPRSIKSAIHPNTLVTICELLLKKPIDKVDSEELVKWMRKKWEKRSLILGP